MEGPWIEKACQASKASKDSIRPLRRSLIASCTQSTSSGPKLLWHVIASVRSCTHMHIHTCLSTRCLKAIADRFLFRRNVQKQASAHEHTCTCTHKHTHTHFFQLGQAITVHSHSITKVFTDHSRRQALAQCQRELNCFGGPVSCSRLSKFRLYGMWHAVHRQFRRCMLSYYTKRCLPGCPIK